MYCIPNCQGDCPDDPAVCRWKGEDVERMIKDRNYGTSARQSTGRREEEPSCQCRRTRRSCAGFWVSSRRAISTNKSTSCWRPTTSTTALGCLTSPRAQKGSKLF